MSESYHNIPPPKNVRTGRNMIYSTRREMNAFESYFQKARLTNERRYMELANKERKSVAKAMEHLKTEIDGLPLEKHAEAAVLISNIRDMLSTHPEFSQDMIDGSIRPKDKTASPAASERSVHEKDDEQFFPPSPTHSVGSVPEVPDDWETAVDEEQNNESFGSDINEEIVADEDEDAEFDETIVETNTHAGPIGSASGKSRQDLADTPIEIHGAAGGSAEENPNAKIDEMGKSASTIPKHSVNKESTTPSSIPNMAPNEENGIDQVVKGATKLKIQNDTIKKQAEALKKQDEEMKKRELEHQQLREQHLKLQLQMQQLQHSVTNSKPQQKSTKLTLPPQPDMTKTNQQQRQPVSLPQSTQKSKVDQPHRQPRPSKGRQPKQQEKEAQPEQVSDSPSLKLAEDERVAKLQRDNFTKKGEIYLKTMSGIVPKKMFESMRTQCRQVAIKLHKNEELAADDCSIYSKIMEVEFDNESVTNTDTSDSESFATVSTRSYYRHRQNPSEMFKDKVRDKTKQPPPQNTPNNFPNLPEPRRQAPSGSKGETQRKPQPQTSRQPNAFANLLSKPKSKTPNAASEARPPPSYASSKVSAVDDQPHIFDDAYTGSPWNVPDTFTSTRPDDGAPLQSSTKWNPSVASFHPRPNAVPTFQFATPENRLLEVNTKMAETNLESQVWKVVAQKRPLKKFNGDQTKIDFTTHLRKYESAMSQNGITYEIMNTELQHWFSGLALETIELACFETDPQQQFTMSISRLQEKYGHKSNGLEDLLENILSGTIVKEKEQKSIDAFVIELQRFEINAVQTNRRAQIDTIDTTDRIVKARIPSCWNRWAKEKKKKIENWNGIDEKDRLLNFEDLIKFVRSQALYVECVSKGPKKPASEPTTPKKTPEKKTAAAASLTSRKAPVVKYKTARAAAFTANKVIASKSKSRFAPRNATKTSFRSSANTTSHASSAKPFKIGAGKFAKGQNRQTNYQQKQWQAAIAIFIIGDHNERNYRRG